MIKLSFIVLISSIALYGCNTPMREARLKREAQQCENFGFAPGTDAYANCRMQFEMKHKEAAADFGRSISHAVNNSYGNAGQVQPQTIRANCTSRQSYSGGPVQTTCF